MSATWKKGLRPAMAEGPPDHCKRCGVCCAFVSIPPFHEDELDRLPSDIRRTLDWYTQHDPLRPKAPVPCYFFDLTNRTCLIHEHKPQTCRDFEPGGPACTAQRHDLLGALNAYYNATRQWARHYTRVVAPGPRIQQLGEFRRDDPTPAREEGRRPSLAGAGFKPALP